MITLADIEAMNAVLDDVADMADGLSAEQAIRLMDAVNAMIVRAKLAASLLETAAKNGLEQPKTIDGVLYAKTSTGKWRPEQSRIREVVATRAAYDPQTAELLADPKVAAARAVDMMYSLFVSPSQMPKVAGLEALKLDKSDVAEWERTGTELKRVKLEEAHD